MLANIALTLALVPGATSADQLVCPPRQHQTQPSIMTWLEPEVPYWMHLPENVAYAPTHASDGISVNLAGAAWLQSFAGGSGDGTYALYDTVSGAFYGCMYADTATMLDAYQTPLASVERAVPALRANIVFKTQHGIGFGATPADVRRVYGDASIQRGNGADILAYEKQTHAGSTTIYTRTTFFFWKERLVGFQRLHGA